MGDRAAEAAIRRLLDGWADALRGKRRADVLSLYASSATQYSLSSPLHDDYDETPRIEALQRWLSGWEGAVDYAIFDLRIQATGELAFAHALHHLRGKRKDRLRTDLWFRVTHAFARIGGEWKIVHEHASLPFAPERAQRLRAAEPDRTPHLRVV